MDINDFLLSPIPEIKDLAERAVKLKTAFQNNELTESEYKELTEDLMELKHINQEMVSLEVIRELWKVIEILQHLKFFASLI